MNHQKAKQDNSKEKMEHSYQWKKYEGSRFPNIKDSKETGEKYWIVNSNLKLITITELEGTINVF